jgi:hypothetical protein
MRSLLMQAVMRAMAPVVWRALMVMLAGSWPRRVVAQKSGSLLVNNQVDGSGQYTELVPPKLFIITVDWGVLWGHVVPEVKNAPREEGMDRAEDVVTASSVTNFLAPICILLVGQYEHAEGCGVELMVHGSGEVKFEGGLPQLELLEVKVV